MFEVTEKDLIGELQGFPIEVVRMMLLKQVEQGNVPSVQKFQYEARVSRNGGGFNWDATGEGFDFWSRVIGQKQWPVFFDKYPLAIEMAGIKSAKPLKRPRKMHFTQAQKWCLERMRLNTGPIHNRLKTVLNENLCCTPYFDFPMLPGEIDDALKLFCLEGRDFESLDNKIGTLRCRINETLNSIYYMNQALEGEDVPNTVYICDTKSKGVRSVLNWAKKNYGLLDNIRKVCFGDSSGYHTTIIFMGKVSGIPSRYEYDKTLGAYRNDVYGRDFIIGNIFIHLD